VSKRERHDEKHSAAKGTAGSKFGGQHTVARAKIHQAVRDARDGSLVDAMSSAQRPKLREVIALAPATGATWCSILGCGRPTMKAAMQGLAAFHCARHISHRARHGSLIHGTYRASELKPYLAAAASYVRIRDTTDPYIMASIAAVKATMEEAGPTELATRLRGMPATKRARIAVARLRVAGVKPERIVSIILGVRALIEEDPGSHRVSEFRTVQAMKAIHRLASGTHKYWPIEDADGRRQTIEMHAFPKSTGRVLRLMGRLLEEPCELTIDKHLSGVVAFKVKRYGRHPALG
jgi:hypothetical protein